MCHQEVKQEGGAIITVAESCPMTSFLSSTPEIKLKHKREIQKKLAEKLAVQIQQNQEELALLTTLYGEDASDFLTSNSIKNNCQLKEISKIESCSSDKNPLKEEKLKLLKEFISPDSKESLYHTLVNSFAANLGISQESKEKNQCPLKDDSAAFIFQYNVNESSAKAIIEGLTKVEGGSAVYMEHPQLKILLDSKDPSIIKRFEEYVKTYKTGSAKEFIKSFFTSDKNREVLSNSIGAQCSRVTNNIRQFLCNDLDELGSLDPIVSRKLFNNYDPTKDIKRQRIKPDDEVVLPAMGFSCLAKEKQKKNALSSENTDNWYLNFTSHTRPKVSSSELVHQDMKSFCERYLCKKDDVKNTESCKNGGPLSKEDLIQTFNCDKQLCREEIVKSIDYLVSMKRIKIALGIEKSDASEQQEETKKDKSKHVANFIENYLGVEGSLVVLGKPITPVTIAEKTEEFKQRDINTNTTNTNPTVAQNKIELPVANSALNTIGQDQGTVQDTMITQNERTNQIINHNNSTYSHDDNSVSKAITSKRTIKKKRNSDNDEEIEDLKDDLARVKRKIKREEDRKEEIAEEEKQDEPVVKTTIKKPASVSRLIIPEKKIEAIPTVVQETVLGLPSDYKTDNETNVAAKKGEASRAPATGSIELKETKGPQKIKVDGPGADGKKGETVSQDGVMVSAEELENLRPEELKKLGINSEKPFVIRVLFQKKTYDVEVKRIRVQDKMIFAPVFTKENSALKGTLLKSSLFSEYKDFEAKKLKDEFKNISNVKRE